LELDFFFLIAMARADIGAITNAIAE
jgi:hypothetical protein